MFWNHKIDSSHYKLKQLNCPNWSSKIRMYIFTLFWSLVWFSQFLLKIQSKNSFLAVNYQYHFGVFNSSNFPIHLTFPSNPKLRLGNFRTPIDCFPSSLEATFSVLSVIVYLCLICTKFQPFSNLLFRLSYHVKFLSAQRSLKISFSNFVSCF